MTYSRNAHIRRVTIDQRLHGVLFPPSRPLPFVHNLLKRPVQPRTGPKLDQLSRSRQSREQNLQPIAVIETLIDSQRVGQLYRVVGYVVAAESPVRKLVDERVHELKGVDWRRRVHGREGGVSIAGQVPQHACERFLIGHALEHGDEKGCEVAAVQGLDVGSSRGELVVSANAPQTCSCKLEQFESFLSSNYHRAISQSRFGDIISNKDITYPSERSNPRWVKNAVRAALPDKATIDLAP